jgi:hypothetical protein
MAADDSAGGSAEAEGPPHMTVDSDSHDDGPPNSDEAEEPPPTLVSDCSDSASESSDSGSESESEPEPPQKKQKKQKASSAKEIEAVGAAEAAFDPKDNGKSAMDAATALANSLLPDGPDNLEVAFDPKDNGKSAMDAATSLANSLLPDGPDNLEQLFQWSDYNASKLLGSNDEAVANFLALLERGVDSHSDYSGMLCAEQGLHQQFMAFLSHLVEKGA